MHAEFRDSEADESDERKHRKGFFRAGFFLILYIPKYKSNGKNPIDRQACAKAQRRRYNERSCIPAAALRYESGRQQPFTEKIEYRIIHERG